MLFILIGITFLIIFIFSLDDYEARRFKKEIKEYKKLTGRDYQ